VGAGKRGLMKVQDKKTKQHTTKQKHKTNKKQADYIFQNTEVSGLRFIYPELRTVVMTRQLLASSSPSTLDKSKARSPPAKGMTHIPCGPA